MSFAGSEVLFLLLSLCSYGVVAVAFISEAAMSSLPLLLSWLVEQSGVSSMLRVIPSRRGSAQSFELNIFMARGPDLLS